MVKKCKRIKKAGRENLDDLYEYLCQKHFLGFTEIGYGKNLKRVMTSLGSHRDDLGDINDAMLENNQCIALMGLIVGQVMYRRDAVKDELADLEAEIYDASKKECEESGIRRTERQLDGEVRLHKDVSESKDELALVNLLLRTLQSVQESVLRRDRALEQVSNNERAMYKDEVGA